MDIFDIGLQTKQRLQVENRTNEPASIITGSIMNSLAHKQYFYAALMMKLMHRMIFSICTCDAKY